MNALNAWIRIEQREYFLREHSAAAPVTPTVPIFLSFSRMFSPRIIQSRSRLAQVKQRAACLAVIEFSNGAYMNSQELLNCWSPCKRTNSRLRKAIERLKHLPFEDLDFAKIDHHRTLRQGFAEVIFGKGKTPTQNCSNCSRDAGRRRTSKHNILITPRRGENILCGEASGGGTSRDSQNFIRPPASSRSNAIRNCGQGNDSGCVRGDQ